MAAALLLCSSLSLLPSPLSQPPASRRAVLSKAAAAAAFTMVPLAANAKDKKNYMTMDEYNNIRKQQLKEDAERQLYGLFESLRDRAIQTAEFDKLASEGKMKEVSTLALAWDSNIRKDVLDKANDQLSGKDKDAGAKLSKTILEDLKKLDKLAKAGTADEVPGVTLALKGHVLDFVKLEPQRLADKFGMSDL